MLVLSRNAGELIRIGTDVTLVVLEVKGNRVRLGIAAPPQVAVVRGEHEGTPPRPPTRQARGRDCG